MVNLKKTAIVTGGSRGIGAAISSELASMGYNIHISYLNSDDLVEKMRLELMGHNVSLTSTKGDISEHEVCEKIVKDCIAGYSRIDALILNAGIFIGGSISDFALEDWRKLIDTNLSSAIHILKYAIPELRRTRGNIVITGSGSISNPIPAPQYPLYEASKAGLYVLMKSLSVSEGKYGVRVNMISPGLIDSGGYKPGSMRKLESEIPSGRMGKPSEAAKAVSFLISEQASYINGCNIDITGGWVRQTQE